MLNKTSCTSQIQFAVKTDQQIKYKSINTELLFNHHVYIHNK